MLLGGPQVVVSFAQANARLQELALIDPPTCSDKVDFTIVWDNGETYTGTYLLTSVDQLHVSLQEHMTDHMMAAKIFSSDIEVLEAIADLEYNFQIG